jgi:hypothetical protein
MSDSLLSHRRSFSLFGWIVFLTALLPSTTVKGQSKSPTPAPPPPRSAPPQPRPAPPQPSSTSRATTVHVPQQHSQGQPAQTRRNTPVNQPRSLPKPTPQSIPVQSTHKAATQRNAGLPKPAPTPGPVSKGKHPEKSTPGERSSSTIAPNKPVETTRPFVASHETRPVANVSRPVFVPPSKTKSVVLPDGGAIHRGSGGREWQVDQGGHLVRYSKSGLDARFGDRGQLNQAHVVHHGTDMMLTRDARGHWQTEAVHSDHSRAVILGQNRGFVEHKIAARPGYVVRNYVIEGRPAVRVYRAYVYRDINYFLYVPVVYFQPLFYRWLYSRWSAPVDYDWGWSQDPWFVASRGYFTPDPSYPTPSSWMTDYLIAENLRLAFESRDKPQDAGEPNPEEVGNVMEVPPEVKQAFSEELGSQLAEIEVESKGADSFDPKHPPAASEQRPPVLDPKHRLVMVSMNVSVNTSPEETCVLSGGDFIARTGDEILEGNKIGISVLASKPGDCPYGSAATIEVSLLQELSNETRSQVHAAAGVLASKQGVRGIPVGPDSTLHAAPEGAAAGDASAESQLQKLQKEAEQAKSEIKEGTNGSAEN